MGSILKSDHPVKKLLNAMDSRVEKMALKEFSLEECKEVAKKYTNRRLFNIRERDVMFFVLEKGWESEVFSLIDDPTWNI